MRCAANGASVEWLMCDGYAENILQTKPVIQMKREKQIRFILVRFGIMHRKKA